MPVCVYMQWCNPIQCQTPYWLWIVCIMAYNYGSTANNQLTIDPNDRKNAFSGIPDLQSMAMMDMGPGSQMIGIFLSLGLIVSWLLAVAPVTKGVCTCIIHKIKKSADTSSPFYSHFFKKVAGYNITSAGPHPPSHYSPLREEQANKHHFHLRTRQAKCWALWTYMYM